MRYVIAQDRRVAGPFLSMHGGFDRCRHRDTTVCDECVKIAGEYLVDVQGEWILCDSTQEAETMRAELTHLAATAAAPDEREVR